MGQLHYTECANHALLSLNRIDSGVLADIYSDMSGALSQQEEALKTVGLGDEAEDAHYTASVVEEKVRLLTLLDDDQPVETIIAARPEHA